jgi:putative ABC transport system permease protein
MLLLTLFAALALSLSAIGVFGVVSYALSQRTHEIGIRMALGSEPNAIVRMVLLQGAKPALIGIAVGIAAALAATRLLRSLLFDLSPRDPFTLIVATLLLSGCALLAALIPARRAAKADPVVALRCE